ncbi:NADPH-dependent diflavin oxidoreductase 1 [Colletotrichum plurivorum]|uniref:NADPH-dependent diflavin oxidoreductase 1 n=1 Tax=Colletotrichum plurivorum TaxID=2175906 RepID=A0A8H6NSZ8_9PEZI|nr:NADPH-dependent diflavin oxidoreductase 1 [Colletotrichum plurivorum]
MMAMNNGPEPANVADLPGRSILILYGSETGNGQDIAEELGRNAQRLHFKTKVDEMNGAQLSMLLKYTLVAFVISTTGQGDMPRNSVTFWKSLLRKKLPPGCLGAVKFTTFGLGDSMYIKFNWAVRKLHKRLEQLGAQEFYPRGEADEQDSDGVDERYMPWAADLRKKMLELFPLPSDLAPIPEDALLPPRYSVSLAPRLETNGQSETNISSLIDKPQVQEDIPNGATTIVEDLADRTASISINDSPTSPPATILPIPNGQNASLELNKRVTPESHSQDVRLVRLALPGQPEINPFDSLTIYPKNFPRDVQKLIDLMHWAPISDLPLALPSDLPRGLFVDPDSTTTLRHLLTHNLDITCVPRRSFLKEMSYFATDPYHKERLLEFTMREYTDEFYDYTTRPRRTIIEVLEEFTSVQIPLARVLDMFPVMRGRDYSIASTKPSGASTSVDLLIALLEYQTVLKKMRQGLCSRYLESLPAGTSLRITLNHSSASLHGPANARRPLVAVATGTGVAPLRLFVEERLSHPTGAGDTAIFFGNRSRHADYHFKDVWHDLQAKAASSAAPGTGKFDVHTAFSRDKDTPKTYVQDVIRKHPEDVRAMIASDAIFVVCGGSLKMSRAVKEAVKSCMAEDKAAYPDEAALEVAFGKLTWWEEIW